MARSREDYELWRRDRNVTPTIVVRQSVAEYYLPLLADLSPGLTAESPEPLESPLVVCTIKRGTKFHECKQHAVFLDWR